MQKKIYLHNTSKKGKNPCKHTKKLIQQCAQKKIKKNNELKCVKVEVVTYFVIHKDKTSKSKKKVFLMVKFILEMMMTLEKVRSLDLDKMCVASNKILEVGNGPL